LSKKFDSSDFHLAAVPFAETEKNIDRRRYVQIDNVMSAGSHFPPVSNVHPLKRIAQSLESIAEDVRLGENNFQRNQKKPDHGRYGWQGEGGD